MGEMISVIIPVYNMEKHVSACLDSVLASAYENLEVLCVDDGSTDASGAVLEEYARADGRIKVIHKANGGAASARNCGLDAASGECIAFVDSDDQVHEMFFRILLDAMLKNEADLVLCSNASSWESMAGSVVSPEEKMLTRAEFMSAHNTKSFIWGRLYRREMIGDLRFDETIHIEDAPFNAALMQANPAAGIVYVDLRLYLYNQREESLSKGFGREEYYELGAYYCDCAETERDPAMKSIFAEEGVKRGLSAMLSWWMDCDTPNVRRCQVLLRRCVSMTENNRSLYRVFVACPALYKQYRFLQDPTLRGWKRKKKSAGTA